MDKLWLWREKIVAETPASLDSLLNVAARIMMMAAMLLIFLGLYQLAVSPEPDETHASKMLVLLHSNWRALLIIAVPIFYPAIRHFIEEVEEIGGMMRRRRNASNSSNPQGDE